MNNAAKDGNLKKLIKLHNENNSCTADAMNWAAEDGYLEIVKWLHLNRSEGCTIYAMNWAAAFGHLEVVKWLHKNRTEGCTTEAMNWAASGHLEVVKWLHENRTEVERKILTKEEGSKENQVVHIWQWTGQL